MTRIYTKITITALLCLLITSSCKKDTPVVQKEKTKTELISAKGWKAVKTEYNTQSTGGTFVPSGPFTSTIPTDAVFLFTADHKYSETESDGVSEEGTWKFNDAETSITLVISRHGNPAKTSTSAFTVTADTLVLVMPGTFTEMDEHGEFVDYKQKRLTFTH
ncbi:hypothetical protein [Mucilaginibacter sp. AK015]|uniref:hypothetical protein n=1 Tax=Mucilaginibacter sp. AK015 TaxID=2723072 RepID=UPI001620B165|nr:hypothetical protein [Mucilaginibacter sp. AK015]MBB5397175.1 hypothetical protein [Mucilaginibacter sp. AK015]